MPRGTGGGPQRDGRRASFGSLQNPAYRPAPPFIAAACYGRPVRRRLAIVGVVVAAAAGLALGLLLAGGGSAGQRPGVVTTSRPLPTVAGTTIDGGTFSASEYRGHVLVLNFWNPYCAPCRAEATVLDLAQGELGREGVV